MTTNHCINCLRQGGYVFTAVCVCVSVCKITQNMSQTDFILFKKKW